MWRFARDRSLNCQQGDHLGSQIEGGNKKAVRNPTNLEMDYQWGPLHFNAGSGSPTQEHHGSRERKLSAEKFG